MEKEDGREVDSPKYGVPPIKDMIGRALSMVGTYGDLDNTQQKVALIDEVSVNPKVWWYKWLCESGQKLSQVFGKYKDPIKGFPGISTGEYGKLFFTKSNR